jgi:hypothetical protein
LEGLGLALAVGLAAGVLILRSSPTAALSVGAALALGAVIMASLLHLVLRMAEDVASALRRWGRELTVPRAPDVPWKRSPRPRTKGRAVRFLRPVPMEPSAETTTPLGTADLLARAVGTVDLLTRRPLRSGDRVFLCLGRHLRCGACFPADIREDLRLHYDDRCPACRETGRFADAVLPTVAAAPAFGPPAPAPAPAPTTGLPAFAPSRAAS